MNKAYINTVLDKYTLGNVAGMGYQVAAKETPLCEVAFKYRVDKCEKIKHPFTPFYYDLLNSQRRSIRKVVQIGVEMKRKGSHSDNQIGASLRLWQEFFPGAQIFGAAADPLVMFREGKIKTVLCDQSKKEDLLSLLEMTGTDIDLFIDDGTHTTEDQVQTCLTVMPHLQKDALYIIEDVKDLDVERRLMQFDTRLISLRASNGRRFSDDKMIVVRHRSVWS